MSTQADLGFCLSHEEWSPRGSAVVSFEGSEGGSSHQSLADVRMGRHGDEDLLELQTDAALE